MHHQDITPEAIAEHLTNAEAILAAELASQLRYREGDSVLCGISSGRLAAYQVQLCSGRYSDLITTPSFAAISKTPKSWLVIGDRRAEVAARVQLVIERHGLGVGLLLLHLQQIHARHILTELATPDGVHDLAAPTDCLHGAGGELVLSVPIRAFRSDFTRLEELNIAKPKELWTPGRIVTHERDGEPCYYCSCAEINPAEVVIELEGTRHGLSRDYALGFTFAPFGNPLSTVHFLAWDRAHRPLNMNRTPVTVSDLVKFTREINLSIRTFFAESGARDCPVIDGLSNGWAGNTIYHQHFQFFHPEHPSPITRAHLIRRPPIINRDDVTVERLDWPCPVYRIHAADALNTGLVGNDLAGIWRLLGGSRKVPYKTFREGYIPTEGEKIHVHTQNLYVPGRDLGRTAFLVLRDRERVHFRPAPDDFINAERGFKARRKDNLGALETTGTVIMDDWSCFSELRRWPPEDVSRQVRRMIAFTAPAPEKVAEFESAVRELFPQ